MSKLYIGRSRKYDMYWGKECGREVWTNNINKAILLPRKTWNELMTNSEEFKDIVLYEREYKK